MMFDVSSLPSVLQPSLWEALGRHLLGYEDGQGQHPDFRSFLTLDGEVGH